MKYLFSLTFLLFLFLVGCAGTGSDQGKLHTPENLAKRQWQACSHYPSVELVEITDKGNVLVKHLHYSSPPVDFQRCLARVAYQQVLSSMRSAKSLIRDAYFIDTRPAREYLYKPSGHYPVAIHNFSPEQSVYFFFVMDAPNTASIRVSFDWTSPLGESIRTTPRMILSKGAAARRWSVEQLVLPGKTKGRWSVRLFIENFDAGEYSFNVE